MVFKKGNKPHNKGHVLRDANFAAKPQKKRMMDQGVMPEQGTQFNDPKIMGKNNLFKEGVSSGL